MLNLTKAAEIMRRELFEPRGLTVPDLPMSWAPADPLRPTRDGGTEYVGLFGPAKAITLMAIPINRDPVHAAAILAHEMAHVATTPLFDPWEEYNGHPEKWRKVVTSMGLDLVKPWYTVPGPEFVEFYNRHLAGIADA
jgi:hypothetical protein